MGKLVCLFWTKFKASFLVKNSFVSIRIDLQKIGMLINLKNFW